MKHFPRSVAMVLAAAVVAAPSVASAGPPSSGAGSEEALVRAQLVGALFSDRRAATTALGYVSEGYNLSYSAAVDTSAPVEADTPADETVVETAEAPQFEMAVPEEVEESPLVEVPAGKATVTKVKGVESTTSVYSPAGAAHTHSHASGDAQSAAISQLEHYGNGRIPSEALMPIGIGSHRLWAPAAAAFQAMMADAAADGIRIGITDSYRPYEVQVDLVRRKGLYSQGGLAAAPGTSDHGWGLAVDLDLSSAAQAWMRANAGQYGFVEDTPREPWHWGYHG